MKHWKKILAGMLSACMLIGCVGCSTTSSSEEAKTETTTKKRIIRIAHSQAETHPEHIGLLKFKEYVEENLEINMKFRFSLMSFWDLRQKLLSLPRQVPLILY